MARKQPVIDATKAFEKALDESESQPVKYILKLYVAGNTARAQSAIIGIRQVCEERLKGRYQLEVIDIYSRPELARGEQIIATPTLIKYLPLPLRRVIGDLSKADRIIVGLDLIKEELEEEIEKDKHV